MVPPFLAAVRQPAQPNSRPGGRQLARRLTLAVRRGLVARGERSPARLGRELRPVSIERGLQSSPAPPWRLPPVYFPPSQPVGESG
ncbi:MAG: hypothetical protein AB1453_09420 [Chloroflexota bacterium]